MCVDAAEYVNRYHPQLYHITVFHEVPCDYNRRYKDLQQKGHLGDKVTPLEALLVEDGSGAVQTSDDFLTEVQGQTAFRIQSVDPLSPDSFENRAQRAWMDFLKKKGNLYSWISVRIGDRSVGLITFELYSKVLPRTCQNFWLLCRGDVGTVISETDGGPVQLTYKGTTFFRILRDTWVMGGDVTVGHTGNGVYSCYGQNMPDESFHIPHDGPGILGMCNDGPNTSASSFYITLKKMSWMNGRYVAFGRVIDGMDVLDAIHDAETKHNQSPMESILIDDCGVLNEGM
ncbi:unnamed protein product [Phytomonas sp. Hart1]|nr:unnamed protein product [Phytomonas sp. Hart1]|eukprot:CCW71290.1 unnamed protein product [Phytomonas sp. isolate Hart1]